MMRIFSVLLGGARFLLYRIVYIKSIRALGFFSYFHGDISISGSGSKVFFGRKFRSRKFCSINLNSGELIIGDNVFFNRNVSVNCHHKVSIGDNSLIAEGVKIYDHDHVYSNTSRLIKDQGFDTGEVIIGKNVWVGSNTVILRGARIGDNSVIAAGSIVKGNIPSGTVFVQKREATLIYL